MGLSTPGRQRLLVRSVAATTALVLAAGIALAVVHTGSPPPILSSRSTSTGSAAHGGATAVSRPVSHHQTSHSRAKGGQLAAPATGTTVPIAVAEGSLPVIDALSPSSGGPGQVITVSGANFMSADGQVIARVNGQVAPTNCPSQTDCTVNMPALAGVAPGPVQVTVTTGAGTSSPASFDYQG
jgi:hypothetical protein